MTVSPEELKSRAEYIAAFSAIGILGMGFYLVGAWKRRSIRLILRGKTEVYKRDTQSVMYWYTWIFYSAIVIGLIYFLVSSLHRIWPNQSPEPTAVAAAVAIHATSRRWLSFFR